MMRYPSYTYAVGDLFTGSSLGNLQSFARLDEQTNVKGLWSARDNQYYLGEWTVEIVVNDVVPEPRTTTFFPESQVTDLVLNDVTARKTFFIPFAVHGSTEMTAAEMRTAVSLIRLTNASNSQVAVTLRHLLTFPALPTDRFTKQPTSDQTGKKVAIVYNGNHVEITTVGDPGEVRVFRSSEPVSSWKATETMLQMEYSYQLDPGTSADKSFMLHFSPEGMAATLSGELKDAAQLLERTRRQYRELLSRTFVFTPDSLIIRGIQWSKVNTVRVQHQYRTGEGFTNDPPQDIIVVRDLAWYVLGSDYLTPGFSEELLKGCEKYAFHDGGKLTEYFHADEERPARHDYGLNINDDTPLYVYALFHHGITSPRESLRNAFGNMKRASDWITSQIRDGLVRCRANGTNVWGICGWRNIIDDYNLSGAVTEVNAECYYALSRTADVARYVGEPEQARHYNELADQLKKSINTTLVSPRTGLYLLNLSNDGVAHHDLTGDLIFPVMFDVAEGERREEIVNRLLSDEFSTPYGTRTVSPAEKNYDPDFGCQLVGGLWLNLTAWIAYCARREYPDKLVEGMRTIYRLCEIDKPRQFVNVVPGQFPERLHGKTFVSRGMAMSPWLPPTYLWLGVEGLLGVKPLLDDLEITPAIPAGWKWIAVRDLLYRGNRITAFLYDGTLYSTERVTSGYSVKTGVLLSATSDNDSVIVIGMMVDHEALFLVASDEAAEANLVLEYHHSRTEKHVRLIAGEAILLRFPSVTPPGEISPIAAVQK